MAGLQSPGSSRDCYVESEFFTAGGRSDQQFWAEYEELTRVLRIALDTCKGCRRNVRVIASLEDPTVISAMAATTYSIVHASMG